MSTREYIALVMMLTAVAGMAVSVFGLVRGRIEVLGLRSRRSVVVFALVCCLLFWAAGATVPSEVERMASRSGVISIDVRRVGEAEAQVGEPVELQLIGIAKSGGEVTGLPCDWSIVSGSGSLSAMHASRTKVTPTKAGTIEVQARIGRLVSSMMIQVAEPASMEADH